MRPRIDERDNEVIDVVVRLLETEGYEAVQVRRVAAEASVSLTTIYKRFGSRDELVIRAIERWMLDNAYAGVDSLDISEDPLTSLTDILRVVFAPWEQRPHMLVAFIRARLSPGGMRLQEQGLGLVGPRAFAALGDLTTDELDDIWMITEHVLLAALERFATGEIAVTEIVPILERTLRRVVPAEIASPGRRTRRRRSSPT